MPVAIQTITTSEPDTAGVLAGLRRRLDALGRTPNLLFVFYDGDYDEESLKKAIQKAIRLAR